MTRRDPLDRPATLARVRALVDDGVLPRDRLGEALERASLEPDAAAWSTLTRAALLVVGAALSVAGVGFFFAYDWASLGRASKVSIVAFGVLLSGGGALSTGLDRPASKALLSAASALVGVLLAVYGQAYQTGADSYLLFSGWAVLIAPWAIGGGFAPIFALFVGLVDTSIALYWDELVDSAVPRSWMGLELSAVAVIAWVTTRALASRAVWLDGRGLERALVAAAFAPITFGACAFVIDDARDGGGGIALVFTLALVVGSFVRFRGRDLFGLAAAAASLIAILTSAVGKAIVPHHGNDAGALLLLGFAVVGEIAAATVWLRIEARSVDEAE